MEVSGQFLLLLVLSIGAWGKECPPGYYQYMNSCYFFSTSAVDWDTAKVICQNRGGSLAGVNSADELAFLTNTSVKIAETRKLDAFYLGLTDAGTEGTWRNVDGSTPAYTGNWHTGQPDNFKNDENCITLVSWGNFQMNDEKCTMAKNFICERNIDFLDPCDVANGWHLLGDKCYKFYTERADWLTARKTCKDEDGDLLAVNTADEEHLVAENIACQNNIPVWLGYSDQINQGKSLQWVDGSSPPDSIMKWDKANGQPNTKFTKNCGVVIPNNKNMWQLSDCDANENQFICEKPKGQCPLGWTSKSGVCYKTFYTRDPWATAKSTCQDYGGSLITAADIKNDKSIVPFYSFSWSFSYSYWVDFTDRANDGTFIASDGTPVPADQLSNQTPNKKFECGVVDGTSILLSVDNCYVSNPFICKASLGTVRPQPPPATPDGLMCYADWDRFKGNCYRRSKNGIATYSAAQAACKSLQADLLIIENQEEMDYLASVSYLTGTNFWIGLDDLKTTGTYVWNDGKPINAYSPTNWAPNEPNGAKENCVEVMNIYQTNPLAWNDILCDQQRQYICKTKAIPGTQITTPKPTRPWSPECGTGWVSDRLSGNCYFFSEDLLTWNDASKACQSRNSELLSVEDRFESAYIQGILKTDTTGAIAYWTGGNDLDTEGGWRWSDGKPFKYLNFEKGEPNSAGNEDCIEIITDRATWNDNFCNQKRAYICKKTNVINTTPAPPTTPLPEISTDCKNSSLLSGDHWVSDGAMSSSSDRDDDSRVENSRIDWTATDTQIKISTPDSYFYQPVANLHLRDIESLTFTVKACSDVHISLQPSIDNVTQDTYEIVIGGWRNTKSVIRLQHQSKNAVEYMESNMVDCREARPFWISWANNIIAVGKGAVVDGSKQFMQYKEPNPKPIVSMAVTTGFGASGEWVINNPHGTRKGAWSPKYSVRSNLPIGTEQTMFYQWIQVDFGKPTLINGITTKGSASANEYVTEYTIRYSYDNDNTKSFESVKQPETGYLKYFPGNTDQNTAVTNWLETPIEAQYIRLEPTKFINYPSLRWELIGCPAPKFCTPERLVAGESYVDDFDMDASSYKPDNEPEKARLKALPGSTVVPKGWIANIPDPSQGTLADEWIEVYLGRRMMVYGIITKGHAEQPYWVKSYALEYTSTDDFYWYWYQEPFGVIKTFTANTDQNTEVINTLSNPVIADTIVIYPKSYEKQMAMRFDVLGCHSGCSLSPLIDGPKPVDNKRLSASSRDSSLPGLQMARLDTKGYGAAWVPKQAAVGEFFQVDFGVKKRVLAVTTQGRYDKPQWVKSYRLAYSYDGKSFYNFQGVYYTFDANSDQNTKRKNFLDMPMIGNSFRIYPLTWQDQPAMRVEFYGCSGNVPNGVGCYLEGNSANFWDGPSSYITYNSPARCSETCFNSGYPYAGLTRSSCLCGSYPPQGATSNKCDYKCAGDSNLFCGGYASNLISIYETGLAPDDERCPVGYDTYDGQCYKLVKDLKSWQDARKSCQAEGAELATINTEAQQAYLTGKVARLDQGVWIGLNDLSNQMSFEWADGSPVKLTKWMHTEPNNFLGKKEDCVEAISEVEMSKGYSVVQAKAENGLWNDRECSMPRNYLCQSPKVKGGSRTTQATPVGCPYGWKAYDTSCYLLLEHYSTWSLASTTCKNEGGNLVRVDDEYEQNFLTTELFRRDVEVSNYRKTLYWTDLRSKTASNDYVWSNDWEVIPYTHWDKGQPQPDPLANSNSLLPWLLYRSNCVAMNGKKESPVGYWISQSCTSGAFAICEKPRGGYTQPALPTLAPEDIQCPNGWLSIGSACYQVNTPSDPLDRKSWTSAQKHCKDQGANLAYIENAKEMDYLWRNYLLKPSEEHKYWIGLNERSKDKGYVWVSSDPFSYTNWADGEPNDWDGSEPCVLSYSNDGKWNDEMCHIQHDWICSISKTDIKQVKQVTTTPEPQPDSSSQCDSQWQPYNGKCYKVTPTLMSYQEANKFCADSVKTAYGHLATIQSATDNSIIRAVGKSLITNILIRDRMTIGSSGTQFWIGLDEIDRTKGHRWVDGSSYKFTNWADNEPNDWNGGEYCAAMFAASGEWNDVHCSYKLPSVCMYDPQVTGRITTAQPPVIAGYCPSGYVDFENSCYKLVLDQYVNWTSAEFFCGTEGGHLAHVANNREQIFLTSQLAAANKAKSSLWIGLQHGTKIYNGNQNIYYWSSNADVTYTNWNTGEPNGKEKEECSEMLYNPAGRWNDLNCDASKGYICRKPKDGTITTPPASDNTGCPPQYIKWNDACYKYIDDRGTWPYVDGNVCQKDGAQLLSIQDPYEYSFIRQWVWRLSKSDDFWIGLTSKANSNSFVWSNFWPVTVTYWGANEPTNFVQEEGCVLMNPGKGENDGRWKHVSCKEMHPAICKKPLTTQTPLPPATGICKSAAGETWVPSANGFCYLFNLDPRYSYDEASSACRAAGADLASLHSDDDTTFISTYIEHMDVQVVAGGVKTAWIGLRKLDSGSYEWSDGSAVYYSNWAVNEPNSKDEKCTELYSDAKWNDQDCNVKRGFICRIQQGVQPATFPTPAVEVPTTPTTTVRASLCQLDGWQYYNGSCYLLVAETDKLLRWNEADAYCRAPGRQGHLASIGSEAENQWIVDNLLPSRFSTDAWIGFAELQTDNTFSWTDGSYVTYMNWADRQPNINRGSMECTSMAIAGSGTGESGRWATEYCFSKKAFICKIDSKATILATQLTPVTNGSLCSFPFTYRGQDYNTCTTYGTAGAGEYLWCSLTKNFDTDRKFAICDPFACPPGWVRKDRLCYYFSDDSDKQSWVSAEASCAKMSADLGFIGDATAESFITNNINEYYWIGLNDRAMEGRFQWDHRPNMVMVRGFTNWGVNEPRNIFGTEDCVQIVNGPYSDGRPGEWVMENCELPRRYVCMKDATYTLSKPTSPATQSTQFTPSSTPIASGQPGLTSSSAKPNSDVNKAGNSDAVVSPESADVERLRTGEIVAIVLASVAFLVAGIFVFLYIRRVRPMSSAHKDFGIDNATYRRSDDSVHVGIENPNFSTLD